MLVFTMAQAPIPKPEGFKGYVDMNRLEQIGANDPKWAEELVKGI